MYYNDVSLELRNKIRRYMEIDISIGTYDGSPTGVLRLELNEKALYEECRVWVNFICTYFSTSPTGGRISKIGRFYNLKPTVLHQDLKYYRVYFNVEYYDPQTWFDWFDVEGNSDGDFLGHVGKIINERTCNYASIKSAELLSHLRNSR
jgi:hypothetical protein